MTQKRKTVMVGMSGGVDSTVTALLLKEQGYEVAGVTFKLWQTRGDDDLFDPDRIDYQYIIDARNACDRLEIPHYVFDYTDKFIETVVDPFIDEYYLGRTPNPCIQCNKNIKFKDFLYRAKGMGYDYIATGHYSIVEKDEETGLYHLKKGKSKEKDQSYFLYNITQEQLSGVLLPLGEYNKEQVREIAKKHDLESANRPDSQDICFIPNGDYVSFLEEHSKKASQEGDFVDTKGNILGKHSGIENYTVGQRKGLGVSFGKPVYVLGINSDENQVILGDNEDLFSNELVANNVTWTHIDSPANPIEVEAKIRYASEPSRAVVTQMEDDRVKVDFDEAQRAITPGQSVVFYHGDTVLGGGIIED